MFFNNRIKSPLSFALVLLFLGTTNHCALEDFFTIISVSFQGKIQANHNSNPINNHNHEESSGSHEHGQPHQLVSVQSQKTGAELLKIFLITLPLYLIATHGKAINLQILQIKLSHPFLYNPTDQLKKSISSLVSAPQGPPYRA